MENKKKLFCLTIFVIFLSFLNILKVNAEKDDGIYTYVFHINYDGSKLFPNPSFSPPYTLLAGSYSYSAPPTSGNNIEAPARGSSFSQGIIIGIDNKTLANFNFTFSEGQNEIYAPYFPNAKSAIFPYGTESLTIDLSGSSVCNENGICDSAAGETYQNCPSDCKAPITPTIAATIITKNNQNSYTLIWVIASIVAVIFFGALGILYYANRKQ